MHNPCCGTECVWACLGRVTQGRGGMARLCALSCLPMLRHVWRDRSGSSLIEYSVTVALMVTLVVVGVRFAGAWVAGVFSGFAP